MKNEEEGFVETNQTQREFNLSVAKRSVRNCPWSSQLWINYALLLKRTNSPVDSVKALFNGAMNGGLESSNDYLQLWHAYLDFLKRLFIKNQESKENQAKLIEELREYFQKAINQQFDCWHHKFKNYYFNLRLFLILFIFKTLKIKAILLFLSKSIGLV